MLYFFIGTLLITANIFVEYAASVSTDSIFFRCYNRNDSFVDIRMQNASQILLHLTKDTDVAVYIHGYTENVEYEGSRLVSQAYLTHTNHNIISVDYREFANLSYPISVALSDVVGKAFAGVFDMIASSDLNITKIHVIGHSLGSQVAGSAARQSKKRISRVTGLDPAGPMFYTLHQHLSKDDAEFVDIIHTDMGIYGIAENTGHIDFYANSGHRPQPGCPLGNLLDMQSVQDVCAHHRSYMFYVDSMQNNNYVAVKCTSQFQAYTKSCNQSDVTVMGYRTPTDARGLYFLTTNAEAPYGQGLDGIKSYISSNAEA